MNSRSVEARSVDHHQHNLGKENQQGDSHHIGRHEPRSSPDNRLDSHILLQPLDYEEAYPHRRGDGAKSGYDGDEDGEPDQVISQRGGQRKEHWNAEGQETQSIREHTTHQVDQDDYQQYPHVRHIEPHYPLSESHRKSRIGEEPPQDYGARHTTPDVTQPPVRRIEHIPRHSRPKGDISHQHKEGDHAHPIGREASPYIRSDYVHRSLRRSLQPQTHKPHQEHGKGNGHAGKHEHQQQADAQQGHNGRAHLPTTPLRSSRSSTSSLTQKSETPTPTAMTTG